MQEDTPTQRLRQRGLRVTRPRLAVLAVLEKALQALQLLVGQRLGGQRRQAAYVVGGDAQSVETSPIR